MVTVRYKSGLAAVFNTEDEAIAQAAHDNTHPFHAHLWEPAYIVTGDYGAEHAEWGDPKERGHKPPVDLLVAQKDASRLSCGCVECLFQRESVKLSDPQERHRLRERLELAELMKLYPDLKGPELEDIIRMKPIRGAAEPGTGFTAVVTAALVAATAKTMQAIVSSANTPVNQVEYTAGGDATSGNLLIEIVFGTNATAGTTSAFTPLQVRGPAGTINATSNINYTAEPTVLTVVKRRRMPMPAGPWVLQAPLGREVNSIVTASATGKLVGIRLTGSVAFTNADVDAEIEE